jgi:alpha-tubulin suppressor-like RCC1 family protein
MASVSLSATVAHGSTAAAGNAHTVVVASDGTVWAWGTNNLGQVGDGTTTQRPVPTAVATLDTASITVVAAGANHTLALSSDGTVWAWGLNTSGQLGDGTTTNRTSPVHLTTLTSVVAISAGGNHSVALRTDGTIYTWGLNTSGELGINSTTQSTTPVLVSSTLLASAVGAGTSHTLAVATNGTVWSWGKNSNGQLGDGTTTQRLTPVQMSGVTAASAVSGGDLFSLVRLSDGTIKAVGYNGYGQLGDGTTTQRTAAVTVSGLTDISQVATGGSFAVAASGDGALWTWGNNGAGQLGLGTTTSASSPQAVSSVDTISVVAAGASHLIVASQDGIVSVAGANSGKQLGNGTSVQRTELISISDVGYAWRVASPVFSVPGGTYSANQTVVVTDATAGAEIHYTTSGVDPTATDAQVVSGGSVAVTENTTLKARAFKDGMPSSNVTAAVYVLRVATPAISPSGGTFTSPRTVTITDATSGATIRYTTDGSTPSEASTAYAGPFAVGTTTTVKAAGFKTNWTSSAAASVTYTMNFGTLTAPGISPSAGTYEDSVSVALSSIPGATIRYTTNGSTPSGSSPVYTGPVLLTASATLQARAFHPDYTQSAVASAAYVVRVATPTISPSSGTYAPGQAITIATATPDATIRYTIDGTDPATTDPVIASGGTVTAGTFTVKARAWKTGLQDSLVAVATYVLSGEAATRQVAGGVYHTVALRQDGTVWTFGGNGSGQLGDGTSVGRTLPSAVAGITGAIRIAAGGSHTVALRSDGTLWSWGQNAQGQLGDGTTTGRSLPVAVSGLSNVIEVASHFDHTLALKNDGTVWAWGRNIAGQLGDGTTTNRTAPVQVQGLSNVVAIAAGFNHSLALASDGTVWAWGTNADGQLGDGTTTNRLTPVQVTVLTDVVAIAAGQAHSIAVTDAGLAWVWGNNVYGQLGLGDLSKRTAPVQVPDIVNVTAAAVGRGHTLLVTTDGSVHTAGLNNTGQLGDGGSLNRASFQLIATPDSIQSVAAGQDHAIALTATGIVWSWGVNDDGQLGDGTTTDNSVAVDISGPGMSWKTATPVLNLASGTYFDEQQVTVTTSDTAAMLTYTLDGIDPTPQSLTVTSGQSVSITQSSTLKVRGWRTGAPASVIATGVYELKVVTPTVAPGDGGYTAPLSVAVSTSTAGATIYYTLDGAQPTESSTVYGGALSLVQTATVRARAYRSGWTPSDPGEASYWIAAGTVPTPTIVPSGGTVTAPVLVRVTCALTEALIRYTVDGSEPTEASPAYTYPFVVTVSTTVKARAFKAGYTPSGTAAETFSLDAAGSTAIPSIVPSGGMFATAVSITVSGPAGSTLRYTTDGTDPEESSTEVPVSGQLTIDRALVLKVRAWDNGLTPSPVRRADFVVTGALAAGSVHTLALKSDRTVWAWGSNYNWQIGDGVPTANRRTPVQVLSDAIAIAAGTSHSVAAKTDGSVWQWGDGTGSGTPIHVSGLTNVVAVAAGWRYSLALKSDGTVWAWGGNGFGQLGIGSVGGSVATPAQIPGLSGISEIAAGYDFAFALQRDGGNHGFLWAWGNNDAGQLGDGTTTLRPSPVLVTSLSNARHVRAGLDFALAELADGSLAAWGNNLYYQLGVGTNQNALIPIAVPFLRMGTALTTGNHHALVVNADGITFGWGRAFERQLGQDVLWNAPSFWVPTIVPSVGTPVLLAGGSGHTAFSASTGAVMAFGVNGQFGVLGNGSTDTSAAPVSVSGLSLADNAWLASDVDRDGLTAWTEHVLGTDPLNPDTNGNGLLDGPEAQSGGAPANADTDGDGIANGVEQALGTDPFVADTDGDGADDNVDAYPLDPARSQFGPPDPNDHTPPVITLTEPTNAVPIP